MAERLKRINYSIYLDPLNNPADLYASQILHQWADDFSRLKAEPAEDNGLALINARNVQKQVYLSGLFMHLLNPELSQQLSLQVTESQVSASTLERTLLGVGLLAKSSQPEMYQQVQHEMLEDLKASILEQVKAESVRTREHLSSSTFTASEQAREKVDMASGSLEELHKQNEKLVAMLDMQSQQFAVLKQQLASQTALIRTMSTANTNSQIEKSENNSPVVNLNERLAHVQKIRKKGIF